jgi:hypothetical protein
MGSTIFVNQPFIFVNQPFIFAHQPSIFVNQPPFLLPVQQRNVKDIFISIGSKGPFIKYARKPQAFKPGEEWHTFEASQVGPGEAE